MTQDIELKRLYKRRKFLVVTFILGLSLMLVDTLYDFLIQFVPLRGPRPLFMFFIQLGIRIATLALFIGYVFITARVLAEQRKVDEALRISENRFRELADMLPSVICEIDRKLYLIYVNQEGYQAIGHGPEDIKSGINILDTLHEDDRERARNNINRIVAGESLKQNEYRMYTADGRILNVLIKSAPLYQDGTIVGIRCNITDITERKQVEEALGESEQRYRALFDAIPDAIILSEPRTDNQFWPILDCNQAACRMNGYSREELIGQCIDIFHKQKQQIHERLGFLEQLRKEKELVFEEFHRKKDGTVFSIESRCRLITLSGKEVILGIDRDITDRKLVEAALRESEEKYRTVVENVEEAIFISDIEGHIYFTNRYTAELLKWDPEDYVGKTIWDALPTQFVKSHRDLPRRVVQTGKGKTGEMYAHVNNKYQWFRFSLQPLKGSKLIVGIAMDITEQKRYEEELASEKERLDVTLRSIGEGVIATDVEGRIMFLNPAAEKLTGWKQEEAAGKGLNQVFRSESEERNELAAGRIEDLNDQTVLIDRQGRKRIISENGAAIRDSMGRTVGMVFVFRDITEQKRMEDDLLKTQKLESIGYLAGGIAHDFNNILAVILMKIQMIQVLSERGEGIAKYLDDMEKAVGRANALTHQLLTFSKGGKPVKKRIYINDIIHETVGFSLNGSNVRAELDLPNDLWPAEVDEGQITQVLNNIMINADQAMPEGGVVRVKAENFYANGEVIVPLKKGRYLKISITDEGVGISQEHLEKIFDPYFTTKQKGSGLGLATVYSIVKRHDGLIDVESRPGKGSTFYVYLPAVEGEVDIVPNGERHILGGSGRILLMDDEEEIRESSKEILNHLGYDVALVKDGLEAIRLYQYQKSVGKPFDLVIMDLTVPGGMGGKEAVARLRELEPEVSAIVTSGYSNDPVMADYAAYGFAAVIVKPYQMEELSRVVKQVLEKRKKLIS